MKSIAVSCCRDSCCHCNSSDPGAANELRKKTIKGHLLLLLPLTTPPAAAATATATGAVATNSYAKQVHHELSLTHL
jgi:hypothetical protein